MKLVKDFLDKAVTLYKAESEKYYAKYSNIKKLGLLWYLGKKSRI